MIKILKNNISGILILLSSLILLLIRPFFFPNLEEVPDTEAYVKMVEYFRGNINWSDLDKRFISRILVPFIASLFPWEPISCLIVVNIIFTLLSVLIFNKFLLYFEIDEKKQILGTILFMIAGPSLIDGTLPLTDSAGLFFTILALYLYSFLKNNLKKEFTIGIVICIGILARESVLFIAPVIIIWMLMDVKIRWKLFFRIIFFIGLIPLITLFFLKLLIPTNFYWEIQFSIIEYNIEGLFQPLTLATLAQLSLLLIIGIFGNYSNMLQKRKIVWKLIMGMVIFFILVIYIFFSASISSRFFWPLFVFIIPFFLLGINELGNKAEYR